MGWHLRSRRDGEILCCRTPSLLEHKILNPCRDPQPRATEMGRRVSVAYSSGNQWGYTPPGRLRGHLPGRVFLLLQHKPGSSQFGLWLLERLYCRTWVLQRGLVAALSSDLRGPLFYGRLLVESKTVTKLCGLGKRTGLPHLKGTTDVPIPYQLSHSYCLFSIGLEP